MFRAYFSKVYLVPLEERSAKHGRLSRRWEKDREIATTTRGGGGGVDEQLAFTLNVEAERKRRRRSRKQDTVGFCEDTVGYSRIL